MFLNVHVGKMRKENIFMKLNHFYKTKAGVRPIGISLLAALACALVMLIAGESFSSPKNNIALQLPKKPLKCVNVSRRWQLCGSGSKKHFTVGVGIRFNKIDPKGRIVASRSYEDCSKLAADDTLPADIRKMATRQCEKSFHLAAEKAVR